MWRIITFVALIIVTTAGQALAALPAEITSITPALGAVGISTGPTVTVVFNTSMSSSTITDHSFYLGDTSYNKISGGTVTYTTSSRTATLTYPAGTLANNTQYYIVLSPSGSRIKKSNGDEINGGGNDGHRYVEYYFTTVAAVLAPTVVSTLPAANATGVARTTTIDVIFSDPLTSATVTDPANFTVSGGVTGSIAYVDATKTATFTPSATLAFNTSYTVTLTTGIQNATGQNMAANYVFSFTTLLTDTTPPTVSSVTP
ncbi:MAG: Ig-like domain-containing protein, partial [Desulfuromonadaceae bacterium]|nr:Ig-like domain-containing protein [Desulfuromonadaceae bacterium]